MNPATGLPMVGAIDTAGNPYGSGSRRQLDGNAGYEAEALLQRELDPLPPFSHEWGEPRITLDSIERRWNPE